MRGGSRGRGRGGGGVLALGAGGTALERDGEQGRGRRRALSGGLGGGLDCCVGRRRRAARAAVSGQCDQARDCRGSSRAGVVQRAKGCMALLPRSRAPPSAPRSLRTLLRTSLRIRCGRGDTRRRGALRLAGEREAGRAWAATAARRAPARPRLAGGPRPGGACPRAWCTPPPWKRDHRPVA